VSGSTVALLVTDESLLTPLARLCAVAGHDVDVVTDMRAVRRIWGSASAVVVESRIGEALATAGLGRRPKLAVVCPATPDAADWQIAVAIGAEEVVQPAADEQRLLQWLSRLDDSCTAARVIGCMSAVGGAGSSTLSVALAQSAAATGPVTLIDGDTCGGGLDLLMGIEATPGRRWPDLVSSRGVIAAEALRDAVPQSGEVAVVSCGHDTSAELSPEAMSSVLDASQRGCETVVVDLPRRLCSAAEIAAVTCKVVFLVVPLHVRAVVVASALLATTQQLCADVRLVIRSPGSADLTAEHVSSKLGLPVAGVIRTDRRICAMTERGELHRRLGRTDLAAMATRLLSTASDAR
jgi:secretion/DNA translocation related CpaE-like protein